MNEEWAMQRLRDYLAASTVVSRTSDGPRGYVRYAAAIDEIQRLVQIVEPILREVMPGWNQRPRVSGPSTDPHSFRRSVTAQAIARLEVREELQANLGERAPQLDASTYHPWVWEACRTLWAGGTYRFALVAAATVINSRTQAKVGRHDISDHDLLAQAFSIDKPKTGAPRLRLQPDDGTETFRNRQQGAIGLARGLYMGIRNPAAHQHHDTELSENEALEQLAAFSILARWVDEATVLHPETT